MDKRPTIVVLLATACASGPDNPSPALGSGTTGDEVLNTPGNDEPADTGRPSTDGFAVRQVAGESCEPSATAWPAERWTDPTWNAQTVTSASAMAPTSGWGVAVGDFNGDGLPDAYLPQVGTSELFINEGNRRWRNASSWASVLGPSVAVAATAVDFDDDGDLDVVETGLGLVRMLANDGNGNFALVQRINVDPFTVYYGSAWADMDGDGDLDGIVAAFPTQIPDVSEREASAFLNGAPDVLLERVEGGWRDSSDLLPDTNDGCTFISAWQDIDGDAQPEILVMNDHFGFGRNNRVWQWNGESFDDISDAVGLNQTIDSMGLGVTDANGDGYPDLLITGWGEFAWMVSDPNGGPWIDKTAADGLFVAADAGQWVGWGVEFADFDTNGTDEAMVAFGHWELSYMSGRETPLNATNQPDAIFEFSSAGAVDRATEWNLSDTTFGRGVSIADLDRDGRPDLVRRPVFGTATIDSPKCTANHWLTIQLRQPKTNIFGIGAQVTVVADGYRKTRWLSAGGTGLAGSAPPELLFGLGASDSIERVEVLWPDGTLSVHTGVEADRHTTIERLAAP
ncbi:MAG: CRTAC1 family protein [Myxococcota bacterium]|nr:CRTAC1 family protein [Myxococcota bacterium]